MKRFIILVVILIGMAACSSGATSTTAPAPASSTGAASSASGVPSWVPQVAQSPQQQDLSYKPAKSYSSAYDLAKVLGCSVMQPVGNYTPSSHGVNCQTGPAAGISIYSSPQDEANEASLVESNAQSTGNDAYAVFGPDWVAAGGDNYYQNAAQIQDLAGGELVCFSDGQTVGNVTPCSDASSGPVPTPSVSAGPESCPSAPANYDAGQREIFIEACSDWLNQVQQQIQDDGNVSPGHAAADWCRVQDDNGEPNSNDTPAQLLPACRAGIAAAGGPAVSA